MKNVRKKIIFGIAVAAAAVLVLSGCDTSSGTGVMKLSMTDAPLVEEDVQGVYITVQEIQYRTAGGGWSVLGEFENPQPFDLLALSNGESMLMGEFVLPSGEYTQIRFILGSGEDEGIPASGAWIERGEENDGEYHVDTDTPLFIPSGEQTGYKATAGNPFSVPVNGTVSITADFDVRRAVVKRGSTGDYILKPVLRLIVEDEAGDITGTFTAGNHDNTYIVFAYEAGVYSESEADDPEDEDGTRFPNAVTSSEVTFSNGGGEFILAFLAEGEYDIVAAEYDDAGNYLNSVLSASGAEVASRTTTTVNIDLTE